VGLALQSATAECLVHEKIPQDLAPLLYKLVGSDVEAATLLVDDGIEDVHQKLTHVWNEGASAANITMLAAELGSHAEHTELALALIEIELCRRLLHSASATKNVNGASTILAMHRHRGSNTNRTLTLENILFSMGGYGA